jgi:filamentous hemagglutinin family protein
MTLRTSLLSRIDRRAVLLFGASLATLAAGLAAVPAEAQTAAARLAARVNAPRPQTQAPGAAPLRTVSAREGLARQRATKSRTEQIRSYILAARSAASGNRPSVADGLAAGGLDPTDNIREAIAAARAGDSQRASQLLVSAGFASDLTGLNTWEGAGLPSQTIVDGKVQVTIDQTQERALLSWNSFNIGSNTTLQFNQKSNGAAQPGWVAVNRVTNSVAPSQILGNLKADGTVVVLNQQGIIFGQNSQVNTHSLLASTLELGNAAQFVSGSGGDLRASTIAERNQAFLLNGLFGPANGTTGDAGSSDDNAALLVSGTLDSAQPATRNPHFSTVVEGAVTVDRGAQISTGTGGFLILAAPTIDSGGILKAAEGQISLQAGRAVSFVQSTGASTSIDPNVRGYKLNSFVYDTSASPVVMRDALPSDGAIRVGGIIQSDRGYLSLGTGAFGSVTVTGLLGSTTSVSRNGKIAILSGNITLGGSADTKQAAGIEILADDNGETIPLGTKAEPATFKSSQIEIATQLQVAGTPIGGLVATNFTMGANAVIVAPNANVAVGTATLTGAAGFVGAFPGRVDIGSGVIIDVSGLKDVQLDASRNSIEITPVKRNELRDTPNYREVVLDGNFSLNGATLFIDPRAHGVRDDGVAWIGSPLIEAGSIAGQIPGTASEFMTKGGSVSLLTNTLEPTAAVDAGTAPSVRIARDSKIDFSGGWVTYAAGQVRTSRLITNDGRIVDISEANPNDVYVGVAEGFTEIQPRFGVVRAHLNAPASGQRFDPAYDEGRDAGMLTIAAPAVLVDGDFYGNSFAGARQVAQGDRPSITSPQNARALQATSYELPAGGALNIGSMGDQLIYHGVRGSAAANAAELLLNDDMLSTAGLSLLRLTANGAITFAGVDPTTLQTVDALTVTGASHVALTPGGALIVNAGRTIRFDGAVEAASGTITATTHANVNGQTGLNDFGSIFRSGGYGAGLGDDLTYLYAAGTDFSSPLDIVVTGSLSTAGLWINDYTAGGIARGGAFGDGGSISLTVASNIFAAIGSNYLTADKAIDLSGSIRIGGRLNVSAGGYVNSVGGLVLGDRGGDVTLRNDTVYASLNLTQRGDLSDPNTVQSDVPLYGDNQSVDFTPIASQIGKDAVRPTLVADPRSTIDIASASILGFGFAGGGSFTLVAPNISFGSDIRAGSTHIGLDFFKNTGFGTLDLSSYRSRIVDDVFANPQAGKSAFLETTRLVVGNGETLDLTQWILPSILTSSQAQLLRGLGTGADLTAQDFLKPIKPDAIWDQRAAHLVLGGLTELDVLAGGRIVGAPEASITASKLYNAGTIALRGGTISQRDNLPDVLVIAGLGVRDTTLGGHGLADAFGGPIDEAGRFDESAFNAAGVADPANAARLLTNQELVSREGADRLIYFAGLVDQPQGIVLTNGSTTDLSGIALFDPRAALKPTGQRILAGRVVAGGTISLAAGHEVGRQVSASQQPIFSSGRTLVRADGAAVDISGASAVYDQALGQGNFTPYLEWSSAGTISALGGGTLGTTPIAARGGTENGEGGILEWLRPTVGVGAGRSGPNYLAPDFIAGSGFDTLIARGSLMLDGDFALSFRKALMVTSQDPTGGRDDQIVGAISVSATAGTHADIGANYVRLASRLAIGDGAGAGSGNAEVRFIGGAQGIDLVGAVNIDRSVGTVTFSTPGDVRLTGVVGRVGNSVLPTVSGTVVAKGDLVFDARRTYATTGTGNLQALLEGQTGDAIRAYDVVAGGTITFADTYLDASAPPPLSAGTHVRILAPHIVQNGYLAAPLGLLEIGDASTLSVTFGAGSVTTVSGAGLNVPYGSTTDLVEYYYPTISQPITRIPTGQLTLTGGSIVQEAGALIDGRGGGDLFAYEFQSGVGGSRDLLDRINRDAFSSNGYDPVTGIGYQYPDKRQVFALVPVAQASQIALYDPSYSADYGAAGPVDLYGSAAGLSVKLDGAAGIPAGEYLLLPAKYAMAIPGALRVVENVGADAPIPGTATTLLDGSVVVGGTYAYAGTGIGQSNRHAFTVQSKDVFLKYSTIVPTSGSDYISDKADKAGIARSRIPLDAARVVLSPLTELRLAGAFDTRAGKGGRGGEFDILGTNIVIGTDGSAAVQGAVNLSDAALARLGATSLLIGGLRSDAADGTTAITATAYTITVQNGATLQAPELVLAVSGAGSQLTLADGAMLRATGDPGTQPDSDYSVATEGSLLRLSSGGERFVTRTGAGQSTIQIGAASLIGNALTLDSSGNFSASDSASIAASLIALSGQSIAFEERATPTAGVIGTALEAKLAAASRLTVRSPGAIRFSAGTHRFNDLVLDTASIAASAGTSPGAGVTIRADEVQLTNSRAAADGCAVVGFCGSAASLAIDANTVRFGRNDVRAAGFSDGVTIGASQGAYVEGKGSFSAGVATLTLRTPFLVDRAAVANPTAQKVRADYNFLTSGDFVLIAPAGAGVTPAATDYLAPGARIGIGTVDARVRSARIEGALMRATAGIIDVQSDGDITLSGATLATPGYEAVFGDAADPVTVSAGGGTINLLTRSGNLAADARTTLISDNGTGNAGTINLLAGNGAIAFDAAINPDAKGQRGGSFAFDSGKSGFDLTDFVTRYGRLFGGDVQIRSGAGDLALAAQQTLKATNVSLTADGGAIRIAGTIDTSGVNVAGMSADAARNARVNGGDIALWGAGGVTLASTALLDAHTNGYADIDTRPASAGDVTIGIERSDAAITIERGAVIDVGARRTQAALALGESGGRLVPQIVTDQATGTPVTVYRYAEPDAGGTVTLRAPVIGAAKDKVAVSLGGSIVGADSIQLEAFQRYDLDALAASGLYSGLTRGNDGTLALNFAATAANSGGKRNLFTENFTLADGTDSLIRFIQDFDVSTVDGSSLDGVRLRPGVELNSAGAIRTDTQWNLAAASFSPQQLQAAVDAGVLRIIPELGTNAQTGQPYYQVVPGREGDLLESYATFLYRVDGSAHGEAPIVTMRAGGALTINRSISDGFFAFHDKSDPAYINYQLGGGNRSYSPALQLTCGVANGNCSNIVTYQQGISRTPTAAQTLTISLNGTAAQGSLTSGAPFVNSPLALTGNGAAGSGDSSDSLGFADLFPLLSDNSAIHSSDLRLVAGADNILSADPLHVDRAKGADLRVGGEYSYRVTATPGTVSFTGGLQFQLQRTVTPAVNVDVGGVVDSSITTGNLSALTSDSYTQLNWGAATTGLSADARAAAQQYFAGKGYGFVGPAGAPTGIIAPLGEVTAFLQRFEATYQAGLASGRTGYSANRTATVVNYGPGTASSTFVRSYVRTGDGSIDLSAARDIDLRTTPAIVYRSDNGQSQATANGAAQVGGSAIYTAGVRVAPVPVDARIIGGGAKVTITPDSPYFVPKSERVNFVPIPKGLSDAAPVLADNGGDVSLEAGRDILGRRDVWSETYLESGTLNITNRDIDAVGLASQRWRVGTIGLDTEIGIAPRLFSSGVGALGGGDVTLEAGRDIQELIVALDSGVTTTPTAVGAAMLTFGSGELSVFAGRDIAAGRYDIATGAASIHADRDVTSSGLEPGTNNAQYLRIRLSDAVVDLSTRGSATIASVSALGVDRTRSDSPGMLGFYSPGAAFSLVSNETVRTVPTLPPTGFSSPAQFDFGQILEDDNGSFRAVQVLPPSLRLTSMAGNVAIAPGIPYFLFPSPYGQLQLFSAGDIGQLVIAMSDAEPSLLGGAFSDPAKDPGYSNTARLRFAIPYVTSSTADSLLREQHNRFTTHLGDPEPVRIYSNGSIDQAAIYLPKQARITAGDDVTDLYFLGQNVLASDVTRIRAGGDITGTVGASSIVQSNNFILGGPGTLIVEAGGELGPFVTSANIYSQQYNAVFANAGGVRTIGNDYNPWLDDAGADLSLRFGMARGGDYAKLRETYLDPDNLSKLDGDLFEQVTDSFGNQAPDRSKPIYAPILAAWLEQRAPDAFATVFGAQQFPQDAAGRAALAQASYGKMAALYAAFTAIDPLRQQDFLINRLYFNEIEQVGNPAGPSYKQYIRGYRVVQTLFPPSLGYTDNLAAYTLDPATISADHPLGEPVRNIVDGQPQAAKRVVTGNVDLRLATVQTARGGDVSILGPGGDVIAGSVVRTSEAIQSRSTAYLPAQLTPNLEGGFIPPSGRGEILSVPLGFEGVLTLRGGAIRSFTDGDFIVNQSRVFSQAGGDIVMWSSNGDLNAGQGPKGASNFPPITVRFDPNGLSEVNSEGSVAGAGIGTFKSTPLDPPSDVILIAPVGEVDAGDAGVRASGNVVVAAARVANADNFSAAGDLTGVPSAAVTATTLTPAAASSANAAQAASAAQANRDNGGNRRSIITVDVLGPVSDGICPDPSQSDDPRCK